MGFSCWRNVVLSRVVLHGPISLKLCVIVHVWSMGPMRQERNFVKMLFCWRNCSNTMLDSPLIVETNARRDTLHGCREGFVSERRRTQVPVQGVGQIPCCRMTSSGIWLSLVLPGSGALTLMLSSDEEPLMRPNIGRHVVPEASATVGAPRVFVRKGVGWCRFCPLKEVQATYTSWGP